VPLPPIGASDSPFGTFPSRPSATVADAASPQPEQPTAAPRRGILSSLFNNLGLNWIRR
jgi:hypothetical protein